MNKLDGLIERIGAGDESALTTLYHETKTAVYGFALSIVKNRADAEDIMQDAYLQILRAAAAYQHRQKPLAWIFTIVRNLALMKIRSGKRHQGNLPIEDAILPADVPNLAREDIILLRAAMTQLEALDRQIIMLHALSGFKHREIAKLLALPLSTVLSKYQRALKKLRRRLEEGEDHAEK